MLQSTNTQNMKTATLTTVKTVICLSGGDLNDLVKPFQSHDEMFPIFEFTLSLCCLSVLFCFSWGTRWRGWLRHCATSRKIAGSIPDGVIGIFHWHNPSGRTTALGSTQPLTEMSTRNISWGVKAAGEYGWQSYHLHVPNVLKSGSLNLLEPSGPVQACSGIALPLYCFN